MKLRMLVIFFSFLCFVTSSYSEDENPYQILGVQKSDSLEVITKKYRVLAFKYHPDRFTEAEQGVATEHMKSINVAYDKIQKVKASEKLTTSSSFGNSSSVSKSEPTQFKVNHLWDDWGDRTNWNGLQSAIQSVLADMDMASSKSENALSKVFPNTDEWKNKDSQNFYAYQSIRNGLAKLFANFAYDNQDPIKRFALEVYGDKKESHSLPWFKFGGWAIDFLEGIKYLGVDPQARDLHMAMIGQQQQDIYKVKTTVRDSWQTIMIATAFIYNNFDKIVYYPKESQNFLPKSSFSPNQSHLTGIQLASTVLPFIHDPYMRRELILRILGNSGNTKEFTQLTAIYLHEVKSQEKYYPEHKNKTTLIQAWGNVERALNLRDDLSIKSMAELKLKLYTLKTDSTHELSFFKRSLNEPDPADWIYENAQKENFKSFAADLELILQKDQRQRLYLKAQAQKYPEPLKSIIVALVKKIRPNHSMQMTCNQLFEN